MTSSADVEMRKQTFELQTSRPVQRIVRLARCPICDGTLTTTTFIQSAPVTPQPPINEVNPTVQLPPPSVIETELSY